MREYRTEYFNIEPEWLEHLRAMRVGEGVMHSHNSKGVVKKVGQISNGKSSNAIGILNIQGALMYSGAWWHEYFGFTSYDVLSEGLDELLNDNEIKTIILRIQSPGGTAFGAHELTQKIYDARNQKRIVAYSDPYAFSAAYEIGSAASEFYVTPSGMVGSVGSYSMHVDYSQALEKAGLKVTFIKAGEKKTDGNEYEPLSGQAKKDIQVEVDRFYDVFVSDVARNRNVTESFVKENFGKGGRVLANDALAAGMIDGIKTFNEFLSNEVLSIQNSFNGVRSEAFIKNNLAFLDLED